MHIWLKNNPARFLPSPIWNDRALSFVEVGHPNKKKNNKNKLSGNVRSVPDPKIVVEVH